MTKHSVHSIVVLAKHSENPAIQQALDVYEAAYNALAMLVKLSDAEGMLDQLNSHDSYDRIRASMELRRREFERDPETARQWMIRAHPNLWNPDGSLRSDEPEERNK